MTIDLESLACAEALARTLSFTKAARARALSPPAFGRRIQQIEAQLGRPLFVRSTRRVLLAPGADELMGRARRVLEDAEALRGPARTGARLSDIILGTRHELGMSWLMPARAVLAERIPGLRVHLQFGASLELESAVATLRIHAAVTSRLPTTLKLDMDPLHRESYVLVATKALLRKRPLRVLADLAQHTLIDSDDSLPLASYLLRGAGSLRFSAITTLGTIDAIRAAVRASEGVAVLPAYFVDDDVRRGHLVRALPKAPLQYDHFRLVFRRDAPERATLAAIAETLRGLPLQ